VNYKQKIICALFLVMLISGCKISSEQKLYTNPIGLKLADPSVVRHDGRYYIYGTNASNEGYETWSSVDLVNWDYCGFVFQKTDDTWSQQEFWAPEVIEKDSSFYLFYSASGRDIGKRLCVAKSDSPTGPFRELSAPIFDTGMAMIDGHAFIDDDGKTYLYYSLDKCDNQISEIYVIELKDDLTGVKGQPVYCIKPSQKWEGTVWNEAPFVIKNDGIYYLMYTANCFVDPYYQVGYAVSRNPKGPWKKYEGNPILRNSAEVSGPGHNCITTSPDGTELFIVYHRHVNLKGGGPREIAIDRIGFEKTNNQTTLKVEGPTNSPTKYPSNNVK